VKRDFEVWRFDFPDKGEHPVVLISHPDRCARAKVVDVLYCTSQRQSREPYPFEVLLDREDGMDWETFCDCSIMYAVHTEKLYGRRGRVTQARRNAIRTKIKDVFRLNALD
jgi:mRNA-degrading endonuclease toxin of MazEF toxin-antitoxin module